MSTVPSALMGYQMKLYYAVDPLTAEDDNASANWVELDIVKDATFSPQYDEVENSKRKDNGNKTYEPGLRDNDLEFDIPMSPADPGFKAVMTAMATRAPIALANMTGPIDQS